MTEQRSPSTIVPVAELTLHSPAKINLHLRVGAPDPSGFHPLRSWMITTTMHDTLTFQRSADGDLGFKLTCDNPTLACDPTNLVSRAATALLGSKRSLSIHLAKRIPAGAGLGGGSSNAAATLVGLNRLLSIGKSAAELSTIAAALGSDVPFFLGSSSAIATGRGERLQPCATPVTARFAILILPPFPVSTAAAYRTLDAIRPHAPEETLAPFDAAGWSRLEATELLSRLLNDLERAAFAIEPRLGVLRSDLEARLGRTVRMSGSGSTLFTLFDSLDEADFRVTQLEHENFRALAVELGKPSGFSD